MLAQGSSLSGARSYFRECSFPVALGTLSNKFSTKRQINRELCVSELWALREAVSARRALVLPSPGSPVFSSSKLSREFSFLLCHHKVEAVG